MKQKHILQAKKRALLGKKVKQLRAQRKLPANVFGNTASVSIELDEIAFTKTFAAAGETGLIELTIEGETTPRPVLITNIAYHPLSGKLLHVDLQQVDLKEKVTAKVPLELIGESVAVKAGGVLLALHDEIEVEALPSDLPEKFVFDISGLTEIGKEFKVSDLQFDRAKIEVKLPPEEVLILIQEPKKEEEPIVVEPVETETTVQGAKKEGEEGEATVEASAGAKQPAGKVVAKPAVKPVAPEKKEEKKG
ncbi:MAG: hypothetical protein A2804_01470 [Candidatus Pacebacteria bacterium RIFCSPHIGHO2_01_FULL_46_10]|nr:MAG: hypothetical protein A2804_01470 [Candidatus Pacebacteria bacterium RIFCSPHIGHO2_01_FULL_46_10]